MDSASFYLPPSLWDEIAFKLSGSEKEAARFLLGHSLISKLEDKHEFIENIINIRNSFRDKIEEQIIIPRLLEKASIFVSRLKRCGLGSESMGTSDHGELWNHVEQRKTEDKRPTSAISNSSTISDERPMSSVSNRKTLGFEDLDDELVAEIKSSLEAELHWLDKVGDELQLELLHLADENSAATQSLNKNSLEEFVGFLEKEWMAKRSSVLHRPESTDQITPRRRFKNRHQSSDEITEAGAFVIAPVRAFSTGSLPPRNPK
ncbi:hypothetical protein PCE1_001098 [Barthelona sp. PCE]